MLHGDGFVLGAPATGLMGAMPSPQTKLLAPVAGRTCAGGGFQLSRPAGMVAVAEPTPFVGFSGA